jgi:hypothetical protein
VKGSDIHVTDVTVVRRDVRRSERFLEEYVNGVERYLRESTYEHKHSFALGVLREAVKIHLSMGLFCGPSGALFDPIALRPQEDT